MNPLAALFVKSSGYIFAALAGIALGGFVAYRLAANHYDAKIAAVQTQLAQERAVHQADLAAVSKKAAEVAAQALATEHALQDQVAAVDAARMQEVQNEQLKNQQLRAAVDAGAVRLRIAVNTIRTLNTTGGHSVPATGPAAGVDDGAADLAPSARSAYFRLRGAITLDQQKLLGLQDYVHTVCLKQ